MAIKLTEEERNNRIKMVGEYYINTPNASVRTTSQYFKENYFDISIATVSNYIELYKKEIEDYV